MQLAIFHWDTHTHTHSRSVAFHLFSYLLLKGQNWSSPCNCSIKIKLFTGNGWLEADIRVQTTSQHNTYIYLHFPLKENKKDRQRRDDFPVHCQSDLIFAFICFHVAPERSYFQQFIYSELEGSWGGVEGGGEIRRGKTKRESCQTQIKSVKGWFDFVNKIGGKYEHRLFSPAGKRDESLRSRASWLSVTVRYFIVNVPITMKRAIRILHYEERWERFPESMTETKRQNYALFYPLWLMCHKTDTFYGLACHSPGLIIGVTQVRLC